MIRGIYTSASGMIFQQEQLNEIAGNLANVNTNGYKRTELVPREFGELVVQFSDPSAPNRMGAGVYPQQRAIYNTQGTLRRTSNPLNVALEGPGYFQALNAQGQVVLTRDGDFRADEAGYLSSQAGERILGVDNQPIRVGKVAGESLKIENDGTLLDGVFPLGRLKVVAQDAATAATFPVGQLDSAAEPGGFKVVQGHLEGSNVNVISEMVTMITVNKAYSFGQKAITTQDNILNKTVNDYGRAQ